MKTRRKYNWPELIKFFDESGLTQTKLCRKNDLNPKCCDNLPLYRQSESFKRIGIDLDRTNTAN